MQQVHSSFGKIVCVSLLLLTLWLIKHEIRSHEPPVSLSLFCLLSCCHTILFAVHTWYVFCRNHMSYRKEAEWIRKEIRFSRVTTVRSLPPDCITLFFPAWKDRMIGKRDSCSAHSEAFYCCSVNCLPKGNSIPSWQAACPCHWKACLLSV